MSEVKYSEAQFNKAAEIIQALPKDGPVKPTTDDQLYFYKYYKQAKFGDNDTERPRLFDFTGKAKWDAWESVKGTEAEKAWTEYVAKFLAILKGTEEKDEKSKEYIKEIEAA